MDIKTLQDRYRLTSRQSIYDRLKTMGFKAADLSSEQLDTLDKLDAHIKAGGRLQEFKQATIAPVVKQEPALPQKKSESSIEVNDLIKLIEAIAKLQTVNDPVREQSLLERCAEAKWILSSQQLKDIIGTKPKEGQRGSFILKKSQRLGRCLGWIISRV